MVKAEQNGVLCRDNMTDTSSTTGAAKPRPLSPHLSIYKMIPTMAMSIIHRITGAALYFGTVLVAWWLIAAASGAGAYDTVNWFFGTIIGRLILLGYTWALMHHMLGGLKHLMQDTGAGLEKNFTTRMAILQPVISIILTILIWVVGYSVR
jgi:succinate dehydrogenase / fumarate reductase cytochrome b subunit